MALFQLIKILKKYLIFAIEEAVSKACHGGLDPPSLENLILIIRGLRVFAPLRPQ